MEKFTIYRLSNEFGKSLYIGKTQNLEREIEGIIKSDLLAKKQLSQMTMDISHFQVDGEVAAEFIRRQLIQTDKPLYNEGDEMDGKVQPYTVTLKDIDWQHYWEPSPFFKISLFNKYGYAYAASSTKDKVCEVTEEGYPLLRTKNPLKYELELRQLESRQSLHVKNVKKCWYILLDGKRYFDIAGIVHRLDDNGKKKSQKELINRVPVDPQEILILEETEEKKNSTVKTKRTVLGSERWLKTIVLQSVSLQVQKGKPGWLHVTRYLYEGILGLDSREAPDYIYRNIIIEDLGIENITLLESLIIRESEYESAKGKSLFGLLHGWRINVCKEYGVINGQTPEKGSDTAFRIQAGFFQWDNFAQLMKIHYDYLVQVVSNVETAESNLKMLRAQYELVKLGQPSERPANSVSV